MSESQQTLETSRVLALAPGVTFISSPDPATGFVDTPREVFRVEEPAWGALHGEVLSRIDGRLTVAELAAAATMPEARVAELLASLCASGFLVDARAATAEARGATVIVIGRGRSVERVLEGCTAAGGAAADRDVLRAADPAELEALLGRLGDRRCLVVALSDRFYDPRLSEVNAIALRRNVATLFAGVDKQDTAFVGPLWAPELCSACYECLCLRLEINHEQGALRHEYRRALRDSRQPLAPTPLTRGAETAVVGAIERACEEFFREGAAGHALTNHALWIEAAKATAQEVSPVFPVPGCGSCHRRQRVESAFIPARAAALEHAVNARTGIANVGFEIESAAGDPRVYSYACQVSGLELMGRALRTSSLGGAGRTPQAARGSGIGEAVERYAASIYDADDFREASWQELREDAVHPESFALFSEEQYGEGFPFQRFTAETRVRWVRGQWCDSREPVWLPAALVYMPYRHRRGEAKIFPSITTGLAAGPSLAAAMLTSLYEVVERDAVACSWWLRIPPRALGAELEQRLATLRLDFAREQDTRFRIFDVTLDVPLPVSFVVAEKDEARGPLCCVGTACRGDSVRSAEKAMVEASQGLPYVRGLLDHYAEWDPGEGYREVTSFQKHAVLYSLRPGLRDQVGYLLRPGSPDVGAPRQPLALAPEAAAGAEAAFERALGDVRGAGYRPVFVDLTPPDLRHLGVHVVRTLVPGLVQLSGNHNWPVLSRRRIDEVRRRLALPDSEHAIMPHPMP